MNNFELDENDMNILEERIGAIREAIVALIDDDEDMYLLKGQKGRGRDKYKACYWIDVRFESNENMAASILFYEDFRVDNNTGNLHPGRYGYVTFQRWSNRGIERKAPNVKMGLANANGVFVPTDIRHRLETNISIWDSDIDVKTLAEDIFEEFKEFANQVKEMSL